MKNIFKYLKRILFGLLILIALYLLISILCSVLPVNRDFNQKENSNYEIWIKSNGVHLDIVIPVINEFQNWDSILTIPEEIKTEVKYVGFGWGDKDFYTTTPEWSDLKFSTAFNALFLRTAGALHITYYISLSENERSLKLKVKDDQFRNIQTFIFETFSKEDNKVILLEDITYGRYDRFYDAEYKYTLFYTCNTWTNEALKKADLPACVWTTFDKGILYQYKNYIKNE